MNWYKYLCVKNELINNDQKGSICEFMICLSTMKLQLKSAINEIII